MVPQKFATQGGPPPQPPPPPPYTYVRRNMPTRKLQEKEMKPLYKHYVDNEIAYTEDHIPVHKLHMFGMPIELTQNALLDYFTGNYGQNVVVERIEYSVPVDEEYLPTWNAFALFPNARDAAKVLQSSEHMVGSHKFHVQAGYSWLQPVSAEESNELEYSTSPHILHLNDYCLEYVFQYLPLGDQIRLSRTCTTFRTIYQKLSARLHKSVSFFKTKELTLWEARDFIQQSGQHVQSLGLSQWESNFNRCFYAGVHFPNLKELYLYDNLFKIHKLQRILLGSTKLENLSLVARPRTDPLDLSQLKELKKLEISEWNTESLSLPTSIESLTVNDWRNFSCLPNILKAHTRIKKLQVIESASIFSEMTRSQAFASVEVLKLSYSGFREEDIIAQLPKLKKLCIHFNGISSYFSDIYQHYRHQLDHFEISTVQNDLYKEKVLQITSLIGLRTLVLRYPDEIDDEVISAFRKLTELKRFELLGSDISDSSVRQLLINCPKLSQLRINECPNVSENLEHIIISLVRNDIQSGKNQRELPFKLDWRDYSLTNIIQTDPNVVKVGRYFSTDEWFDQELKF